jgi:DNA-binding PucR family transcriptional regulator
VRAAVGTLPVEPPAGAALAGPARVVAGTRDGGRSVLVVADDEEVEAWLLRAARALGLEGPLAVGPSVAPLQAARSAARAAALLERTCAGAVLAAEVVRCDDHEVDLLLVAAPDLARSVAERRLAPLGALTAPQRRRAVETLGAWLAHPARPQAMADDLGLHVQTVRYRLRRLRELLGDALDDPEQRFELALALRAEASLSG